MEQKELTATEARDFRELARLLVAAAEAEQAQAPGTFEEGQPKPLEAATRRLEELPRELGVLLASVGVLGFILPGVAGTPALIAGGLVLWPKTFGKVEGWLSRRFPATHRTGMQQVGRFLDDLDRRFPRSEDSSS
jgi:hypothetical protein